MTPTLSTSMAKIAAPIGVPKRAENPAAIPAMVRMRESRSSSFSRLLSLRPMLPPIWRAAPSRPALPPVRWVRTVDRKISGSMRKRSCRASRTEARINSVPPSLSMSSRWYRPTMARPATGSRKIIKKWSCRKLVAQVRQWAKAAPTTPATEPTSRESRIHLKKANRSRRNHR